MCGRYVSPDQASIERAWHVGRDDGNPFQARYNVQPTTSVPVLKQQSDKLELRLARWGLIPHWWKEAKPPRFSFNARLEEAAQKPMWRAPLRNSRCLVPAAGWYEWRALERTLPDTGEISVYKQPFYIRRRDARIVCFAGLLSQWVPAGASEPSLSCTILTTAAAGPAAEVHDRMPVVLADAAHAAWLDPAMTGPRDIVATIHAGADPDAFEHFMVRTLVNSSRAEGEDLIEPVQSVVRPAP